MATRLGVWQFVTMDFWQAHVLCASYADRGLGSDYVHVRKVRPRIVTPSSLSMFQALMPCSKGSRALAVHRFFNYLHNNETWRKLQNRVCPSARLATLSLTSLRISSSMLVLMDKVHRFYHGSRKPPECEHRPQRLCCTF